MGEATEVAVLPHVTVIGEDNARLAALRQQAWAATSERGLEVLRFNEGIAVLEHKELEKGTSFTKRLDDLGIVSGLARERWNNMLVTTEAEHRKHLRKPLAQLLAGPQIRKLRAGIAQIVADCIAEIGDKDVAELMEDLAWKVPSRVYCMLVSAPVELAPKFAHLSDSTLAPILTGDVSRRQESIDAFFESYDVVKDSLEARMAGELGEDFASVMIRQHREGLQTAEEMIFEGMALLQASIDNTVHQIGMVIEVLLRDPTLWRHLAENPEAIPEAIEEAMRLEPRFNTVFRYAPKDTDVCGHKVAAGSWVFVSSKSAMRDETEFVEPDTFRFGRNNKRALQFGGGPYSCLGQILARMEIHEVLLAMTSRFPQATLAGNVTRNVTNAVNELKSLPVKLQA